MSRVGNPGRGFISLNRKARFPLVCGVEREVAGEHSGARSSRRARARDRGRRQSLCAEPRLSHNPGSGVIRHAPALEPPVAAACPPRSSTSSSSVVPRQAEPKLVPLAPTGWGGKVHDRVARVSCSEISERKSPGGDLGAKTRSAGNQTSPILRQRAAIPSGAARTVMPLARARRADWRERPPPVGALTR